MAKVNEQFLKLPGNYLFAEVAKQVAAFKAAHPQQRVISLGIGDVTRPLCPAVIDALHRATDEMGQHVGIVSGVRPLSPMIMSLGVLL